MARKNKKDFGFLQHRVDSTLLKQARKEGNIVFGSQALKRKLGINARRPTDWDFFSKTPKKSSNKAQMNLDMAFRRGDVFFRKKGKNAGTWKVKHIGKDKIPRTDDDIGVADFTKTPKPSPNTFKFRGVKFRTLKEELGAKKRLLRNKEFNFRRLKDLEDFLRIRRFGNLKK